MKKQMKKIMAILCVAIAVFIISVPVIAVSETVDSEIAASDETNEKMCIRDRASCNCQFGQRYRSVA